MLGRRGQFEGVADWLSMLALWCQWPMLYIYNVSEVDFVGEGEVNIKRLNFLLVDQSLPSFFAKAWKKPQLITAFAPR